MIGHVPALIRNASKVFERVGGYAIDLWIRALNDDLRQLCFLSSVKLAWAARLGAVVKAINTLLPPREES